MLECFNSSKKEEEEDDYGILLGMAAIEEERLIIQSHGGSMPGHAVIDPDRVEDEILNLPLDDGGGGGGDNANGVKQLNGDNNDINHD
ncbi:hypothetical protein QYF36_027058 [Acer negundo]|nr:hypothetical protein QYF36_027058 [Acer negundo]